MYDMPRVIVPRHRAVHIHTMWHDPLVGGAAHAAGYARLAALYPARGAIKPGGGGGAITSDAAVAVPPPSTAADPAEDGATNAALLSMLTGRLGAPSAVGGRWGTSTHEAVRTSEEAATVRGATLASGAKAMLLSTKPSDEFVLAVISASQKMDSKLFKKAGSFKSTKFASEDEVLKITGCRPGAVPPFGSLWGLRTFLDGSLIEQGDQINFNAGLKTHSVRMATADYLEVEQPVVGNFCAA